MDYFYINHASALTLQCLHHGKFGDPKKFYTRYTIFCTKHYNKLTFFFFKKKKMFVKIFFSKKKKKMQQMLKIKVIAIFLSFLDLN